MATNLLIESPDFDKIRKQTGTETEEAIKLLWTVLNQEIALRRRNIQHARSIMEGRVEVIISATSLDDLDCGNCGQLVFNGSTSINLSGVANGYTGRLMLLTNVGTGTITVLHNSGSSQALNRIQIGDSTSTALTTNSSMLLTYVNNVWVETDWI